MQPESYITTYKKHRFSPLSPSVTDIDIYDIAHALSYTCRANGHFNRFYSVAQHSINCAKEAKKRGCNIQTQLLLLLHDASEAYISDITRPVKMYLHEYKRIEKELQRVILNCFKIVPDEKMLETEKEIDNMLLNAEFLEMMEERINADEITLLSVPDFEERDFKNVEKEFLSVFTELTETEVR